MPKQKYYVIVNEVGDLINHPDGHLPIFATKDHADTDLGRWWKHQFKIVPIPADSLHKLILSNTNKKAR